MSEIKMKKVSANFQLSTDSDLYKNIIEPKSSARCLSEFVHDLLDIYNSCSEVRELIDLKIDERNPLNMLKEQANRVRLEHEKTMQSASVLASFIDFKGARLFDNDNTANTDNDNNFTDIDSIFKHDGILDGLKRLLPSKVQDKIEKSIDERVGILERKLDTVIAQMGIKTPLIGNPSTSEVDDKINSLVSNLEALNPNNIDNLVTSANMNIVDSSNDVIAEEVSLLNRKEVSTISVEPTVANNPVVEEPNEKPTEPKTKPKAFGKLMSNIKS